MHTCIHTHTHLIEAFFLFIYVYLYTYTYTHTSHWGFFLIYVCIHVHVYPNTHTSHRGFFLMHVCIPVHIYEKDIQNIHFIWQNESSIKIFHFVSSSHYVIYKYLLTYDIHLLLHEFTAVLYYPTPHNLSLKLG